MMHQVSARGFHFYTGPEKWLAKGVTYGPFRPDELGHRYPALQVVHADFAAIAATGANTIRLYDTPPEALARAAEEHGLRLLIDISWPKHLDVYDDHALQQTCLTMIEQGVSQIREWGNMLGVFLGNEIPSDLVRWKGPKRVERLLRRMYRRAKELAPELLVGFANFPSTEYLKLDFFDFVGFNVYLDNTDHFRDYLVRLRHLYPEKPILLSECGMDSQKATDEQVCNLLPEYLCCAFEAGLAGALVFAWTDEWHTGGHDVTEWSFGLVDHERCPKPALDHVSRVLKGAPQCRPVQSRISVVVASFNGGRTLRECLESLKNVEYTDYEVIVVDDGSTDNTQEILNSFPEVRVVSQENRGLSEARNAGISAATGDIVAFTDSDCVADRDWLYHIGLFFEQHPEMTGVGGPNLTPVETPLIHKAVALAPGHATHVLLSQTEAEHVPGCNMAFRRDALLAVDGFDPVYRKAGDDVDIIWRLQDANYKIGFTTAAYVWHHRRPTLGAYLRQQRGYGEAEALLLRKHPHRFNDRGQSIWRGIIYPSREMRPLVGGMNVQYGVFGTSGYQCIYERVPGAWWFYVTSLEWWLVCFILIAAGGWSPAALCVGIGGLICNLGISGAKAARGWPESKDYPKAAFPMVWLLWCLQPIVRGGSRYWYRLAPARHDALSSPPPRRARGRRAALVAEYWHEKKGSWRLQVLQKIERRMIERQWIFSPNDIWEPWDFSVVASVWFKLVVTSAEECHGGQKRLLKMRFRLMPTSVLYLLALGAVITVLLVAVYDNYWARWTLAGFLAFGWLIYRQASKGRFEVQELADEVTLSEGYIRVERPKRARRKAAEAAVRGATKLSSPAIEEERELENA